MNNKKIAREVIVERLISNPQEICLNYLIRKHFPDGLNIKIDDMVDSMIDGVDNRKDFRTLNTEVTDKEVKFYFKEGIANSVETIKLINDLLDELLKEF